MAATPHLLHADVSAIVARDEFGVKDKEILEAVRNHTLGRPGMSHLSCIVFVADVLEPNRGDSPQASIDETDGLGQFVSMCPYKQLTILYNI